MSIYVYVTRKPDPLADDGPGITEDEWRSVVAADPELSLEQPPDQPGLPKNAVWAAWPSYPGGYPAWFALVAGSVEVKGADAALLTKLRTFACKLNARIVSEEGEEFA